MSRMTETERGMLERAELGYGGDRLSRPTPAGQRALSILTPIFIVVLGLLVFAAYQVFDGWPSAIIIADLIVVFFGVAAWVYADRKNA